MPVIDTTSPSVRALSDTARDLREQYHKNLEGCNITCCLLVADNATEIGKVKRVGDDIKAVAEDAPDFVITVWQSWWDDADHVQRAALVDHLLLHCGHLGITGLGGTEKKTWINKHDFEGFRDEVNRHGAWCRELRDADQQLRMWDRMDDDSDPDEDGAGVGERETAEALA